MVTSAAAAGVVVHAATPRGSAKWARMAAALRGHGADLVHSHGYEADYFAALATSLAPGWRGVPVVMTCHGLIAPDLRHRVMSGADLRAMRRARALIAVADSSADALRRAVPGVPVHSIRNGVRPPAMSPDATAVSAARSGLGASEDDLLVGYVGRLSRENRPDLFLQAAKVLAPRNDRLRFALIGGGAIEAEIRAAAATTGNVRFGGLWDDVELLYSALDVLVLPSDTEGTSRVVQEAQLRGVSVVASAVGGVPSLIQHEVTGLLVPPNQYTATATAITRLADDRMLRDKLAALAKATAGRWSHQEMARSVQQIYDVL